MARSRNIKPSIMDNEDLAALPALTRLLFIYMWMLADREGRLEDRPSRIKKQALGYDDGSADEMLNELAKAGFIERYESQGAKVIQILAFNKHQTPHIRESASELPCKVSSTTKAVPSTNLGSAEPSPGSPDSPFPLPDTPSLIPDSLNSEANASVAKATGKKTSEPMNDKDKIFTYGVPMLVNAGSTDKAARSFLAGLAKGHGDASVVQALRDCIKAKAIDPLTWLAGVLPPKGGSQPINKQVALEKRNRAVADQWLRDQETQDAPV